MNDTVPNPTEPIEAADLDMDKHAPGAPLTNGELEALGANDQPEEEPEGFGPETEGEARAARFNAHGEALQAELDEKKARNEAQDATRRATHEKRTKAATTTPDVSPEVATDMTEAATVIPLTKLSVEELQARYLEEVGRPTGSSNARYLVWKIREARRGRVPVGPVGRRAPGEPAVEHKVLPLRLPSETVAALDDVWRRHGLKSRMDLFRRALDAYLVGLGEEDKAARVRA